MVRDPPRTSLDFGLVLGQTRVEDAVVARCRRSLAQALHEAVHVVLELVEVREGVDPVREEVVGDVVLVQEARPGPRQQSAQDVDHDRQAVALVRADLARAPEWQHQKALGNGRLVHDRRPVELRDPAGGYGGSQTPGDPDLVQCHRAHRGVEDEGSLVAGRRCDADRVETDHRLGSEGRSHRQAAHGHGHADHVAIERPDRVIGRGAEVPAVRDGHGSHTAGLRLVQGQIHGLRPDRQAQTAIAVHRRHGGCFAEDLPDGCGVDPSVLQPGDVARHHVADAVRIDSPQVRVDQGIRAAPGVVFGHTQALEHPFDRHAHIGGRHANGDVFGNLEAIEHRRLSCSWQWRG